MRVIAGSARRLQLKTVPGMATRPTTDRIKETLFNMLQDHIHGRRFLDLFCGSGAIGHRGLEPRREGAVLVENGGRRFVHPGEFKDHPSGGQGAGHGLRRGGRRLNGWRQAESAGSTLFLWILPTTGSWSGGYSRIFRVKSLSGVDEDTLIIAEASLDTDFSYLGSLGFELLREKTYKTNKHVFVSKGELS